MLRAVCLSFAVLATLWLQPVAASAQGRMIAIIAAATDDASIGTSVQTNVDNVKLLLWQVKHIAGIDVDEFDAVGVDFNCAHITRILSGVPDENGHRLAVTPSDTLLFYYAGHGYRTEPANHDKFPLLWCSEFERNGGTQDLSLSGAMARMAKLNPRLVIGIADACNSLLPQGPSKGVAVPTAKTLQSLFLHYRGSAAFSASSPGEYAWYITANAGGGGGLFTNKLLDDIDGNKATWAAVAADVIVPIVVTAPEGNQVQTPQFDDFRGIPARALTALGN